MDGVEDVVVKDEAVNNGAKPMLVYTETKKKEPVKA
jgi:ATP-dependent Clp protease ATP-binding subunit ClpX